MDTYTVGKQAMALGYGPQRVIGSGAGLARIEYEGPRHTIWYTRELVTSPRHRDVGTAASLYIYLIQNTRHNGRSLPVSSVPDLGAGKRQITEALQQLHQSKGGGINRTKQKLLPVS